MRRESLRDTRLRAFGVAPGATVVRIGCAVLGILLQLRSPDRRRRARGGLDVEPRLLAVAAQLSAQHGLAVETVLTDAASTGLPPGSFDPGALADAAAERHQPAGRRGDAAVSGRQVPHP
jgi:hypothetical protein